MQGEERERLLTRSWGGGGFSNDTRIPFSTTGKHKQRLETGHPHTTQCGKQPYPPTYLPTPTPIPMMDIKIDNRQSRTVSIIHEKMLLMISYFPLLQLVRICTLTCTCACAHPFMVRTPDRSPPHICQMAAEKKQTRMATYTHPYTSTWTHTDAHKAWGRATVSVLVHMNKLRWEGIYWSRAFEKVGHYGVSVPLFCSLLPSNTHGKLQSPWVDIRFNTSSISVALFLSLTRAQSESLFLNGLHWVALGQTWKTVISPFLYAKRDNTIAVFCCFVSLCGHGVSFNWAQ